LSAYKVPSIIGGGSFVQQRGQTVVGTEGLLSLSLSLSLCRRTSKEERFWKVLLWTVSLQLSSLMTSHSSFPQIPNSLSPFLSSNISFDFFTVTEEIAHGLQFYL